jgi:membrane protein required for colicin V production
MEGLNFVDYIVIGVLVLSTFLAFMRGFIGSLLSLAGWALSIYLAYELFPYVQPYLESKIKNPVIIIVLGHAALLIGLLIVFGIFNVIATTAVKGMTSGIIDRSLGAAFGVMRGAVIMSFLFFVVATSIGIFQGTDDSIADSSYPKWLAGSRSFPYMKDGSDMIASIIPDSFYNRFQEVYDGVTHKNMDERFMETSIQKMRNALNPKDVKLIDDKLSEEALTKSNDEIRHEKLKSMLEAYEKNSKADPKAKSALSGDEMSRIKEIVLNGDKEMEAAKAKSAEALEESAR